MHLAQLNIARLIAPEGDPRVAEFFAGLDEINALADRSPGFVWRLTDGESNNAMSIRPDTADPDLIVTMSVWESREALFDYVYRSGHMEYLRRRREWFAPAGGPNAVLWWIPEGHLPSVEEGITRWHRLRENGPAPAAFTFRNTFEPQGVS
ncbi:DUF3291 domain-containing protein [Nocardia inohanensis]|uniref:DUF3291 domain-containing protein n=1 Tax=Nocardia inohanensis TaxID=209246 RepID=UPI0008312221|nr:DUF3291 domain-containing protein [Nocardia inohanensis]